jgi:hypothetical protein
MSRKSEIRRGRNITNLLLSHKHPYAKDFLKKYSWICNYCGKEYVSREDAETCASLHQVERSYSHLSREFEDLREFLKERYEESQRLLRGMIHDSPM